MYGCEMFLTLRREQKLKIFIKVTGKVLVKFAASVDQELNQ
jgi:hypothetical protein